MATLADDLGWVCAELALTKPIVVGHSMGGNVVLELAARYPEIPASVVLIDSVILPHQSILDALQPMVEALRGPDYRAAYQQVLLAICLPDDDETRRAQLIASLPKAPQHVVASTFRNHLTDYDVTPAAAGCRVPIAYIGAAIALADLIQFRSLTPHLLTAQTLGSGHFSPLFVPDQINAMLSTFGNSQVACHHASLRRRVRNDSPELWSFSSSRRVQLHSEHAYGSVPFKSRQFLRACASLTLIKSKYSSQYGRSSSSGVRQKQTSTQWAVPSLAMRAWCISQRYSRPRRSRGRVCHLQSP
jgi:hypothetical protein